VAAFGRLRDLWVSYLAMAVSALVVLFGAAAMVEMVYHLQLDVGQGSSFRFLGVMLDSHGVDSWVGSAFVLLTGLGLFELTRRHYVQQWGEIQEYVEKEIKRREQLIT